MSFSEPWWLLGLMVPLLVLLQVWAKPRRSTVMPYDHGAQKKGRGLAAVLNSAATLPAIFLAVVVLILAGPASYDAPQAKRKLTNIEFCLDVSGSMTSTFGPDGNRYDAAMAAINQFLEQREGDAFGLTFFGDNVLHWVPLTSDVSAFKCAPPFMAPTNRNRPNGFGGTSIGKALLACRKRLISREEGDKMILLVSDGYSSDLYGGRDLEIAKTLSRDGIVVFSVHIAEGEIPEGVVNIAGLTDGDAFSAGDPNGLQKVFDRIDEMQVTEVERGNPQLMDDYELLCIVGLSVLGLYMLTQLGLRYTPW